MPVKLLVPLMTFRLLKHYLVSSLVKLVVESFVLNKPYPILSSLYVKKNLRKRTVPEISIVLPNYEMYNCGVFALLDYNPERNEHPRVIRAPLIWWIER